MTEWYYSQNGQQQGPVSFEQLHAIARSGRLHPVKDLVWTSTMKDWTPAGRVPELSQPLQDSMLTESQAPPPPLDSYAPSEGVWSASEPLLPGEALEEISPGSEPIDIMA